MNAFRLINDTIRFARQERERIERERIERENEYLRSLSWTDVELLRFEGRILGVHGRLLKWEARRS
jgi:hypothetical protein